MSQRSLKSISKIEPVASKHESAFDLRLFDSLVNGVIIVDEEKKVLYTNPAVQQMCGLHSNRIRKKELSSILSFKPDVLDLELKEIVDATPYREVTLTPRIGSVATVQVTIQPLSGHMLNGQIVGSHIFKNQLWLMYIHDVTLEEKLQKKYIKQLREKEEFIKKLDRKLFETSLMFELAQGINFFRELNDILNLILTKLEDAFAFSHSMIGKVDRETSFAQTVLVRENTVALISTPRLRSQTWIKDFYLRVLAQGEPKFLKKGDNPELEKFVSECFSVDYSNYLFVPLLHKDEAGYLVLLDSKQAWQGDDDDLSLLFGIANQLLLAIDNNRLYNESMLDALTGIYNLRYFQEKLLHEFKKAKQGQTELSVLMIDVDYFKKFNDNYGHAFGDIVLKQVAQAIKKSCRDTDIVSRYGGEEFVVILPEANLKSSLVTAERIRKKIESLPLKHGEQTLKVTASIGAASYPAVCLTMSELVSRADQAMYVAKNKGRNNSQVYSPE